MSRDINERVRLIDPDVGIDQTGRIYERFHSEMPPFDYIYGVRLDKTVWAGGLCTIVWHAKGELLVDDPSPPDDTIQEG